MNNSTEEPKYVRHARLFELLRQENIAGSGGMASSKPQATIVLPTEQGGRPHKERVFEEQMMITRALASLTPKSDMG